VGVTGRERGGEENVEGKKFERGGREGGGGCRRQSEGVEGERRREKSK